MLFRSEAFQKEGKILSIFIQVSLSLYFDKLIFTKIGLSISVAPFGKVNMRTKKPVSYSIDEFLVFSP